MIGVFVLFGGFEIPGQGIFGVAFFASILEPKIAFLRL